MTAPANSTYTKVAEFDIETGIPLFLDEVFWNGKWARVKKGRDAEKQVTDQSLANSKTDQATRSAQLGAENGDLAQLDVQPGQMSSAAQSQLGADMGRINDTYNNTNQVGLKSIAQRGMGGPSGATSSMENSLLTQRARDENAAYNNAQQTSHGDMLAAVNARQGLQNIYNPNQALGTAANSALDQSRMGSTLGDIGQGLGQVASIGSSVVGMGGLNNLGSNLMNGK